jgi:hypothetical protein
MEMWGFVPKELKFGYVPTMLNSLKFSKDIYEIMSNKIIPFKITLP